MKHLNEYLNNTEFVNLFEGAFDHESVQEVYESFGTRLIENNTICEGLGDWLRNLAGKADKIDDKASQMKDAVKDKIAAMSDAAKKAIENTKKAAADKWDSIKDIYTSVIASVDDAMQKSKDAINGLAKTAGQKIEDLESAVSSIYVKALEEKTKIGDAISKWVADKTNGAKMIAAVTTFTTATLIAAKAGVNSDLLMDIMTNAGIK